METDDKEGYGKQLFFSDFSNGVNIPRELNYVQNNFPFFGSWEACPENL